MEASVNNRANPQLETEVQETVSLGRSPLEESLVSNRGCQNLSSYHRLDGELTCTRSLAERNVVTLL